jgi:hypothetical protein
MASRREVHMLAAGMREVVLWTELLSDEGSV